MMKNRTRIGAVFATMMMVAVAIFPAASVSAESRTNSTVTMSGRESTNSRGSRTTDGWSEKNGARVYYEDGALKTGWLSLDGKWYCFDDDGSMMIGVWQVENKIYSFNDDGVMQTGWQQIGHKWYYFGGSGAIKTGWLEQGEKWYYLMPGSYQMATGTVTIGGKMYCFNDGGVWTGSPTVTAAQKGGIQKVLNGAKLNPRKTGIEEIDQLVQGVLDETTNSSMDTYSKVKAVFDYMIANYTYSIGYHSDYAEQYAWQILSSHTGVCNNYSSAFAVIMRAIGLDCRLPEGFCYTTSGSASGHVWTVIVVDGVEYVFDPQVEQNIAQRDGKTQYYRFGVTYASIPGRYDVYGYLDFYMDEK